MNLINVKSLKKPQVKTLFEKATFFKQNNVQNTLAGKTIGLLFFEASTRTLCSFELAAKRLGAITLNLNLAQSSTQKGENILDTVKNLEAMGVDAFVIRHQHLSVFEMLEADVKAKLINAGAGTNAHPTQALLDAFTMQQHNKNFETLKIAIVGDIRHSRVAHSNIELLTLLGVKDIRLVGPKAFLPEADMENCQCFTDLNQGLKDVDVAMTLRIQKERMQQTDMPDTNDYYDNYALTQSRMQSAKPDAILMHPGPMNRGIEIESAAADGPQSVILQQVENGVYMRMAILDGLFS